MSDVTSFVVNISVLDMRYRIRRMSKTNGSVFITISHKNFEIDPKLKIKKIIFLNAFFFEKDRKK